MSKSARKVWSMILTAVMVFSLLPVLSAAAWADEPVTYPLWVNGEQFTAEKTTITCGEGTAVYDAANSRLTLTDATITIGGDRAIGIAVDSNAALDIILVGNNSISLDGSGIQINDANITMSGAGKLTITTSAETRDGISTTGEFILMGDKATKAIPELKILASSGVGIASDKTVKIENAKLISEGLYAGIDAVNLIITDSTVKLKSSQENCNAAFIREDQTEDCGNITLMNSRVTAESYYPGLFAAGNILIDGGMLKSTSTADSAIWAVGDLTIKGGAELLTNGAHPFGCAGNFSVEMVDIDAKNTHVENIPAMGDNPTIAENYALIYAMAIDSEDTNIDLLKNDGDNAPQFLNLYKNIHFKTAMRHSITVNSGTYEPMGGQAVGTEITITADKAPRGKKFKEWQINKGEIALADKRAEQTTFTMPDGDVELTAVYKSKSTGGGVAVDNYNIDVIAAVGGKVTSSHSRADFGTTITLTVMPDAGYELSSINAGYNGGKLSLTKNGDKYTFTMPSADVEVKAAFTKKAMETKKSLVMQINSRQMSINGRLFTYDAAPIIMNDRTLVPIRIVTETFGGTADWNELTKAVTLQIDGKTIKMTIGQPLAKYGVAPMIIDGRTYVPIRFVADELGASTDWLEASRTVIIEK